MLNLLVTLVAVKHRTFFRGETLGKHNSVGHGVNNRVDVLKKYALIGLGIWFFILVLNAA
jgi:hypothetical protein